LRTYEPFYWFIELEHLITNDEMFWSLFTDVWCHKSEVIIDNPSILSRYRRDTVSLERRMDCANQLKNIGHMSENGNHQSSKGFMLNVLEKQKSSSVSLPNDEIFLYRSFKVEKGKSVRKGVKKLNNPDCHIQEEGKGWSYSFNKANSIFINGVLGTHYYKKYLNMDDKQAKKTLQKNRSLSPRKMNISHNDNFYNGVGVYSVKKKDIILLTDDWGEMEVVVNPKNAKLVDYGFLNIFDLMTQDFLLTIIEYIKKSFGIPFGRTSIMNIDLVYEMFYKLVKKMAIDKPEIIIDNLRRKKNYQTDMKDWFSNITEDGMDFYIEIFGDKTDSSKEKCILVFQNEFYG